MIVLLARLVVSTTSRIAAEAQSPQNNRRDPIATLPDFYFGFGVLRNELPIFASDSDLFWVAALRRWNFYNEFRISSAPLRSMGAEFFLR